MRLAMYCAVGLSLLAATAARANGNPNFTPPPQCVDEFRNVIVGDAANDASCDFNDLQSAINSAYTNSQCFTTVHVTGEHLYTNQALVIEGSRNITLAGWTPGVSCADIRNNNCTSAGCPLPPAAINPLVTISGGVGNSVIHIDGNSIVSLLNLTITGGSVASDQKGGGIYFDGTGSLTLASTTVSLNGAGYGGGISMNGDGGPATLTLNDYSQILVNSAGASGGGIRLEGNSRLFALKPHTLIGFNKALNGNGGGIEVIGPARADIGSPGFNGLPVIYSNDAAYGGGVDILASQDNQNATVRIFSTDPQNPVAISDNFASHVGGGVYLLSHRSQPNFVGLAFFCASDFQLNSNAAQEGAAIYSDVEADSLLTNVGGAVLLNMASDPSVVQFGNCQLPESTESLGAVACKAGARCNEISGNKAETEDNVETDGSTILLQSTSQMSAARFSATKNVGGHFLRVLGDDITQATLRDCLVADNDVSQELIARTDGNFGALSINSCTLANNSIGVSSVIAAPFDFGEHGQFILRNTIIDQPGLKTVFPAQTSATFEEVSYVLTTDKTTLPPFTNIVFGEPTFVDEASGDYHQVPSSLGTDFAPAETDPEAPTIDLDRNNRVFDLISAPNRFGSMDLGPYEIPTDATCYVSDSIFCNGFELGG